MSFTVVENNNCDNLANENFSLSHVGRPWSSKNKLERDSTGFSKFNIKFTI